MTLARRPLAATADPPPRLRRHSEAARTVALALALLTGLGPLPAGAQVTGMPAATPLSHGPLPAPDPDAERARATMTGGVTVMGVSALLGALAVWQWADGDSYVEVMLGDDPGPLIDPSLFLTPGYSIGLAAFGGARVVRGVALHRGASPEVPWTYWLPLAPAAVALGAEALIFVRDEPLPPGTHRAIAAGTAASVLGFWASTAFHAARVDGPPGAAASRDPSALTVVPVLGHRDGASRIGVAVSGDF
jgi:hypothetical protein